MKIRYCEGVVIPWGLFTGTEGKITVCGKRQSFFMNDALRHLNICPEEMPEEHAYVAGRGNLYIFSPSRLFQETSCALLPQTCIFDFKREGTTGI